MNRLKLWRDDRRMWRWRERAANGEIVASSTEGYTRRIAAVRNIALHLDADPADVASVVKAIVTGGVHDYEDATFERIFHPPVHIEVEAPRRT